MMMMMVMLMMVVMMMMMMMTERSGEGGGGRGKRETGRTTERHKLERAQREAKSILLNSSVSSATLLFSSYLLEQLHTMSLSQLRTAVLRHVSVGPSAAALSAVAAAAVGSINAGIASSSSRGYAAAAASTYLDKDAVTSRVLSVVKAFDKVDPSKVKKKGANWFLIGN